MYAKKMHSYTKFAREESFYNTIKKKQFCAVELKLKNKMARWRVSTSFREKLVEFFGIFLPKEIR